MGSPLVDAIIRKFRRDLLNKARAVQPTRTIDFRDIAQGRKGFFPTFIIPPEDEEEALWEAFRIYTDDGSTMIIDNMEFIRGIDSLSDGRLGVLWVGEDQSAFAFHFNLHFSDDDGETWSALDSLNVSFTTPPLGRASNRFGGMVERDEKFMVFVRGLVTTGGDPPARKIYRVIWDGSWGLPSLWYSRTGFSLAVVRPARSDDRSVAGVAFTEGNLSDNTVNIRYVPMDASGNPGTAEDVGDPELVPGFADMDLALVFVGTEPAVIMIDQTDGSMQKKVRVGGVWPGAWTTITVDDPPTSPEIFTVASSVLGFPEWGGGSFITPFSGDAHALKNSGGGRVFTYRRRVDGTWETEDIDFETLDENPMTGADATTYSGEHMAIMYMGDKIFVFAWMGNAAFSEQSLWLLRRTL